MTWFRNLLHVISFIGLASCATPSSAWIHGSPANGGATPAATIQVYSGCTAVPTTWAGSNFYVNAAGSDSNPGTSVSPFLTVGHGLAAAAAAGAGSTVYLQDSGGSFPGYGTGDFTNGVNPAGFIRLMPAPGSSPNYAGWLRIKDSSKILIENLTFQALQNPSSRGDPFISVESDGSPNSSDIVVYNNDMSSAADATALAWSAAQWRANSRAQAINFDGSVHLAPVSTCLSATFNNIHSVGSDGNGAGVGKSMIAIADSGSVLVDDNTLNYIPDDAIIWSGSNIEIARNTITNEFYIGDGNHNDAIQHVFGSCLQTYCTDGPFVIDGNHIRELSVPAATVPLYQQCVFDGAQGIDSFDGNPDSGTITNNDVVNCATHNISFASTTNSVMENNTAIKIVQSGASGGGCQFEIQANQGSAPASNHDTIRNNACSNLYSADLTLNTMTVDHNTILTGGYITWTISGSASFNNTPGTYGTANVVTANANSTVFVTYDVATPSWNLNPIAGSILIGSGTTPTAPFPTPNYPNGTARTAPVNEGVFGP